jgi:hypothetical protein
MGRTMGWLRTLAGIVGFVALALVIGLNSLSVLLQQSDPALAVRLNPLNAEARVAAILDTLNADAQTAGPRTASEIMDGLALAPGDARFFSLLGEVAARRGEAETSRSLYRYALETAKTEIHALLNSLDGAVAAGEVAATVRYLDMTLRRWPDQWPTVEPLLPAILASPGGGRALIEILKGQPPWRAPLIGGLLRQPAGLPLVLELLAGEPTDRTPAQRRDVANALSRLVQEKLYAEAYRFFIITLTEAERAVSGYVHNARFQAPLAGKAFTWSIARNVMADVSVVTPEVSGEAGGLSIRFFDSPVRSAIARQRLGLPFGGYELSVVASATGLKAPKGLFWSVRCEGGGELARLDVPEGTYRARTVTIGFSVGNERCAGQRLSLDTGVNNQSQRARYQGKVRFEQVAIARR